MMQLRLALSRSSLVSWLLVAAHLAMMAGFAATTHPLVAAIALDKRL